MGNSIVCCIDRQGNKVKTPRHVLAEYFHNETPRTKTRTRSDSSSDSDWDPEVPSPSLPALDEETRYWEDFSQIDAKQFASILNAWDSSAFALNMYFFDVAAEQHASGMPHSKISLTGLSEVLAKFYSRHIDVQGFSMPMLDPAVWRFIAVKYEVASQWPTPRRNPSMQYRVDHETACALIRFFTMDLNMRLSSEPIVQQVDAESEMEDTNFKKVQSESPSTIASEQDVLDEIETDPDNKVEAQESKSVVSRLPSPSRQRTPRAKPLVPKLDIASLKTRKN